MADALGERKCEECGLQRYSLQMWEKHVEEEHDGLDPRLPVLPCVNRRCWREFANLELLVDHLEAHFVESFSPAADLDQVVHQAERYAEYAAYCRERGLEP